MSDAELTTLIARWQAGEDRALDEVIGVLYPELRAVAAAKMRQERVGHTLQPTALINEAFERLSGSSWSPQDRRHLKALMAITMRRVLVDHARARAAERRGGNATVVTFRDQTGNRSTLEQSLLDVDDGLRKLADVDTRAAEALTLHYFGGLTYDEIADVLEVSAATVHTDLRMARAWLAENWQA